MAKIVNIAQRKNVAAFSLNLRRLKTSRIKL
jgi:hypothetical protein